MQKAWSPVGIERGIEERNNYMTQPRRARCQIQQQQLGSLNLKEVR